MIAGNPVGPKTFPSIVPISDGGTWTEARDVDRSVSALYEYQIGYENNCKCKANGNQPTR